MSTKTPKSGEDQEVDLAIISDRIGNALANVNTQIFNVIQFFIRHAIILGILFILGVVLGIYLDSTNKSYDHKIMVTPNFASADYLYSKINLLDSKIKEKDTMFLESIGIPKSKKFAKIEVEPIVDIYQFINSTEKQNLELLKLMAEDGDVNKIVEANMTSKNYTYHLITIRTKKLLKDRKTVDAILEYLNTNNYYQQVQKQYDKNVRLKMQANDLTINQINNFLDGLSTTAESNKGSNLVYYNENTQLNDVINTKDRLVSEQGLLRINLINIQKIIKDTNAVLNIETNESINGKLKFVLPLILIGLYLFMHFVIRFYKTQKIKNTSK